MAGAETSTRIERSITMLSQDIDILAHTLRASGSTDLEPYRRTGLIESMKRHRRALRSKLLMTRLWPSSRR